MKPGAVLKQLVLLLFGGREGQRMHAEVRGGLLCAYRWGGRWL